MRADNAADLITSISDELLSEPVWHESTVVRGRTFQLIGLQNQVLLALRQEDIDPRSKQTVDELGAQTASRIQEVLRATAEQNYLPNLLKAIEIITAPWGLNIGARHLTISTSGLVPQIRKLAEHPQQIRLAISFHGARDEVREQIMPVNRKWPVEELMDALRYWNERKKQKRRGNERPQRWITLDGFHISTTEITVGQYERYLAAQPDAAQIAATSRAM